MKWTEVFIETPEGRIRAIAPEIISASRSTDIPARHAEWFRSRFLDGYVKWINPFNQREQYVSFAKTRFIVFWSKYPKPIIPYLKLLDERGINYYFQFTLNNYEMELFEPCIPNLSERIDIFKKLSLQIGKERVIWRFDPLILTEQLTPQLLIERIRNIGNQISTFTRRFVFSFIDIATYKKVKSNLRNLGVECREFSADEMVQLAESVSSLCREWGLEAATCAEGIDLDNFGISHNKCVDDELILEIAAGDIEIESFLRRGTTQPGLFSEEHYSLKDHGQRKECRCIVSKDIGQYNTCENLCVYCYANTSAKTVINNLQRRPLQVDSSILQKK